MSKQRTVKRLETPPGARGRTAQTTSPDATAGPTPGKGKVKQERLTEANRPIGPGGGKKRGDRRDTSSYYTGNEKHASRGNSPRRDVKTRKR
jgi:hypothetical protein